MKAKLASNVKKKTSIEVANEKVIKSCQIMSNILTRYVTNVSHLKKTFTYKHIIIVHDNQDKSDVIKHCYEIA